MFKVGWLRTGPTMLRGGWLRIGPTMLRVGCSHDIRRHPNNILSNMLQLNKKNISLSFVLLLTVLLTFAEKGKPETYVSNIPIIMGN